MYPNLLNIHDILRWILLAAALYAVLRSFLGSFSRKEWKSADNFAGVLFASLLDIQLVIGLALYAFLSPVTKLAFSDFGAAMKDSNLRFFAVEHLVLMLGAVVFVHIGRIKSKKAQFARRRHRISAIYYTIALLLILAGIPWERAWPF